MRFFILFCFYFLTFNSVSVLAKSASEQEALSLLANILENPKQRQELINQLRIIAKNEEQSASEENNNSEDNLVTKEASASEEKPEEIAGTEATLVKVTESTRAAINQAVGLPRRIAQFTGELANQVGERINRSWDGVRVIFSGRDYRLSNIDWLNFRTALQNLGIIIISVLLIYHGLRYLMLRIRKRLNDWAINSQWSQLLMRKLLAIFAVTLSDCFILLITYILANAIAIYAVGETGRLSMQAALFINAFTVIELLKIGIRIIFTHRFAGLRLLSSDNSTVHYWYGWITTLINLLGYGYLVAIPLIEAYLSHNLAQLVATVIAITTFIYGTWVVIVRRKQVRNGLLNFSKKIEFSLVAFSVRVLAYLWHYLALAYFLMLLVVTLLRAEKSLPFVLQGTLKTLLIIGGSALIINLMKIYIKRGIKLPEALRHNLPTLERQINHFVPLILRIGRLIICIFAFLGILSAWNFINISAWLSSEKGQLFIDKWLGVALILLFNLLLWIACSAFIEHRLSPNTGNGAPSAREKTLLSLLRNVLAIFFFAISLMMVLSQIGINIGPLIAGAGVLGLAIGFGAQTLVKDVITGIFIQIENAMNTGDFVMVNGISGTAEKISIRSVSLRDAQGAFHLIPFSSVSTVSNYTRGYAFYVKDYGIGYNEDIDYACEVLQAAFDELAQGEHKKNILEPINILGVSELAESSVNIRVRIKTLPGEQWTIGRAYNRLVKLYFDKAGIEIPYPHRTLYWGQIKDGNTPPLHIAERSALVNEKENQIEK